MRFDISERVRPQEPVITVVLKAVKQKAEHPLYCINCGWMIGSISDRVLLAYDGRVPMESYDPDKLGFINIRCKKCKQDYRLEVAA